MFHCIQLQWWWWPVVVGAFSCGAVHVRGPELGGEGGDPMGAKGTEYLVAAPG